MKLLIKLTNAGENTGPFDLYSNVDNYTTMFETNISRGILMAGYITDKVPEGTTSVRVSSKGACMNYVDIQVPGLINTTTTTSTAVPITSTTTTSSAPVSTTTTSTSSTPVTTTTTSSQSPSTTTTSTTSVIVDGNFEIINQYATGLVNDDLQQSNEESLLYENANSIIKQMSLTYNPSTGKVAITINQIGGDWNSGDGKVVKFRIEYSPIFYTKEEVENMDFRIHKGKDISICGHNVNPSTGEITETRQLIFHVTDNDGGSKLPTWFKRDTPTKRIASPARFPTFDHLPNKINAITYSPLDSSFNYENQMYVTKGYNTVYRPNATDHPLAIQYKQIPEYDNWAYSNGCPTKNETGAISWLEGKSISQLKTYYSTVIQLGQNNSIVFSDFEAWGGTITGSNDASNKMATLFKYFKTQNPTTTLGTYAGAYVFAYKDFDMNITEAEANTFNSYYNVTDYRAISLGFFHKQVSFLNDNGTVASTGYMSDYIDMAFCGNYVITNVDSRFYSFVQEMELTKKYYPDKKAISLFWSYVESLSDTSPTVFRSVQKLFVDPSNFHYKTSYKIAAPMSDMYNRGLWANFIGDGQYLWHDPNQTVDGVVYYGDKGFDDSVQQLPLKYYTNSSIDSQLVANSEISSTIGYDYNQLALYELSLNTDILNEATTSPNYAIWNEQTQTYSSYYTGDDLKPASAEFKKIPLVRLKKHATLNEYLLLAMNIHLPHHLTQKLKVVVDGQTLEITLNGQFSTFLRIRKIQ